MAAPASMFVALKTLFVVLTCIMAAALVYLFAMDHFSSCFDPSAWWMIVVETDVIIDFTFIAVWFFYKELSWIKTLIFVIIIFWCGSFATCGYIVMQLFKLSPQESSNDPLYFVIARNQKGDAMGHTRWPSVVTAKVIVVAIGCYMLGILIYAFIVDGMPFHSEILTPCMITSLFDIYIHVVVFSVWIAYKESSWISAAVWILSLVCFGSMALCVYILQQLFYLSPEQPVSLILFNQSNRDLMASDPLLTEHSINV